MIRRMLLAVIVGVLFPLVNASADDATKTPKPRELFNGKTLEGWEIVEKWRFQDHGPVEVRDGVLHVGAGDPFAGVRYKGEFPRTNYEVEIVAQRVDGDDFFLGVVFPVGEKELSFVCGGWNGEVVGFTSIDGEPAVENETCEYVEFKNGRWYTIRLRVTDDRVALWIDKKQVVDFDPTDRELAIYWDQEPLRPFGLSSYNTTAAYRVIRLRSLDDGREEGITTEDSKSTKRRAE